MLGRKTLPPHFVAWNKKWKAPFGPNWGRRLTCGQRLNPWVARLLGPFAYQPNNTTRILEYPWAYYTVDVHPGMTALELGGALAGFQFVLARAGATVTNIDPFVDYGSEIKHPLHPPAIHARLNRIFGTRVRLRTCLLADAAIASDSVDVVYSISTLEHLPEDQLARTMSEIERVLKPGGVFVATIDLFLNIIPFTSVTRNRWGTNISICKLASLTNMTLVHGAQCELFGYPEFSTDRILSSLDQYLIGDYPALTQMIVLKK